MPTHTEPTNVSQVQGAENTEKKRKRGKNTTTKKKSKALINTTPLPTDATAQPADAALLADATAQPADDALVADAAAQQSEATGGSDVAMESVKALVIKNKITELVKQSGCSMSHAQDIGTVATLSSMIEQVLAQACLQAKKRNKKATRPQVTRRDFGDVIDSIKTAMQ